MTKSSPPDPINDSDWILEHSTGDAGIAAERVPDHVLPTLRAVLDAAALAETTEDAATALQLAYHLFVESGGVPRQRRRALRVLPGGRSEDLPPPCLQSQSTNR